MSNKAVHSTSVLWPAIVHGISEEVVRVLSGFISN